MTTQTAANFVITTVKTAKSAILENGVSDAQTLFAVCSKLANDLNIPINMVVDLMENL